MECDFVLWYRKFGRECDVDTYAAGYSCRDEGSWFEITTSEKLDQVCRILESKLNETMMKWHRAFAEDIKTAVLELYKNYESTHIALDVVADIFGPEMINEKAREIYAQIPVDEVADYLDDSSKKYKAWMINRCDAKYIIDHELYK